jgi:hypothetical protein
MLKTVFIILIFFTTFLNFVYAQKTTSLKSKSVKIDSTSFVKQDNYECSKTKVNVKRSILLSPQIKETSGLIFFNDLLWTHNDDTDNYLYGIDTLSGKIIKTIRLTYHENIDWEEISQDENYIYVGDIGNNKGNRKDLKIYRVEKEFLINGKLKFDTISFRYELQTDFNSLKSNTTNFDCESFIVTNDSIYLFTKEWSSLKTSIYSISKLPGNYIAKFIVSYPVKGLITGAVYVKNKNRIILCGYSKLLEPFVFKIDNFQNGNFSSCVKNKIGINLPLHQIEGITTSDGSNYFLVNEYFSKSLIEIPNKLHHFKLED